MPIFLTPDPAETVQSTLAEIERETAPRLGPYKRVTASAGASAKTVPVGRMVSSLPLGGIEDLFLLRRGKMAADGSAIAGFTADDRQRIIVNYLPDPDGLLEVDRDWATPPVDGEDMELHYLDPADELRPIVLAGLRRCRIVDKASVTLTGTGSERDLTALAPWIRQPTQVYETEYSFNGSIEVPSLVSWWRTYDKSGHVWMAASPDPFPNTLLITHWRYAATLVNGAYSSNGPSADDDLLRVPVRYAAAAAHIEAFRYGLTRARVIEAAKTGVFINQDMARDAFEQEAAENFHPPTRRLQPSDPWNLGASVHINAAGPRD